MNSKYENLEPDSDYLKDLRKTVEKQGYTTVNINDLCYFTVGMSNVSKPDLFGLNHYPYGLFQMAASAYYDSHAFTPNRGFYVEQYKIKDFLGEEPARMKYVPFSLRESNTILQNLTAIAEDFNPIGYAMLHGPDANNRLFGEKPYIGPHSKDWTIDKLVLAVKEDIEEAIKQAEATLKALRG